MKGGSIGSISVDSSRSLIGKNDDTNGNGDTSDSEYTGLETIADKRFVWISMILTILLPPIGCIAYCINGDMKKNSARYIWAYRALKLGSLLSFLYSLMICSLIHNYVTFHDADDILGYTYSTQTL
ncbi:hypothetical protein BdWA1_003012 [Babesia duncani]|uniref:Uncharacterized protein n=1 Tax=Babesia duncani TaxID=323732 RepID=A0AAD9PIS3_9APIC|nr:hypothetical protein BdWA1_003012 [Babesia duncani]